MLFLPGLKLNVHLHLRKFNGFLSSQHVVRDFDDDDGGERCCFLSFISLYAMAETNN